MLTELLVFVDTRRPSNCRPATLSTTTLTTISRARRWRRVSCTCSRPSLSSSRRSRPRPPVCSTACVPRRPHLVRSPLRTSCAVRASRACACALCRVRVAQHSQ
jgi:hypothetical protein